jgi:hypothetical protein
VVPRPLSSDGTMMQNNISFSSLFAELADLGSKP